MTTVVTTTVVRQVEHVARRMFDVRAQEARATLDLLEALRNARCLGIPWRPLARAICGAEGRPAADLDRVISVWSTALSKYQQRAHLQPCTQGGRKVTVRVRETFA